MLNLQTKRHSLAHIMAQAVKENFPKCKIATGPDTEDGFYYDFDFLDTGFSESDLKKIEKSMKRIITQNQDFRRFDTDYDTARIILKEMWEDFKNELIDKFENENLKNNWKISFYLNISKWKSGDTYSKIQESLEKIWVYKFEELDWDQIKNLKFIDMCSWPHIESTKELDIDSFNLSRVAWAYWLGNEKNKQLTRVYAYAFDDKNALNEYLNMLKEAKKRDHKILWKKLGIFTISELIGSWLPLIKPAWMIIRKEIEDFLWSLHKSRWYFRVWTPHIAKESLYETSGHASKFWDELFRVTWKEDNFILKPMNCPHHMQIFSDNQFSYRDMPIRYFEPATVYREEKSWQLWWLTRVRAITQDDWHLFCKISQIKQEIKTIILIVKEFYDVFGMTKDYWVSLSVRWEDKSKYLWGSDIWEKSETALKEVADENKLPYKVIKWEAAFYWPKLDFIFKDAIGREWQLATIQCDFNLPIRFDLNFTNSEWQKERPVVIHRAIAGSLERFMWVLIEHFAWTFPLWLAPRQVIVIPVWEKFNSYALGIERELKSIDVRVDWDYSNDGLNKKIRNAEKMHINYILVVWEKEVSDNSISVRNYKTKDQNTESLDNFKSMRLEEIRNKVL